MIRFCSLAVCCGGAQSAAVPLDATWTLPTVLAAGLVDGFNPCAFSVAVVLAGVLAAGGRSRRARLLGGFAFCLGSYATYLAIGLGLLQAVRTLAGLRIAHDAVMTLLGLSLFALSFLSVRDAFRYRRERTPAAIALQLPARVKALIRSVAERSWRGPAVAATGLACGFFVTILDSLCTGQVYLPVLALLSREPGVWCLFGLLLAYNLAFIAPLLAIFLFAAAGADSARLSVWSKRNVFPAKLALGLLFAVLGVLVLPRFGGGLARVLEPLAFGRDFML